MWVPYMDPMGWFLQILIVGMKWRIDQDLKKWMAVLSRRHEMHTVSAVKIQSPVYNEVIGRKNKRNNMLVAPLLTRCSALTLERFGTYSNSWFARLKGGKFDQTNHFSVEFPLKKTMNVPPKNHLKDPEEQFSPIRMTYLMEFWVNWLGLRPVKVEIGWFHAVNLLGNQLDDGSQTFTNGKWLEIIKDPCHKLAV